jgi:hypothetical protein
MKCKGTAEKHCCWIPPGNVCPHFNAALVGGFCSLRRELGSWQAVHASPRYAPQRAAFEGFSAGPTSLCGDFPVASESPCATCGAVTD